MAVYTAKPAKLTACLTPHSGASTAERTERKRRQGKSSSDHSAVCMQKRTPPPGGLIAVRTNSSHYPVILVQPGKGVWFPEAQTTVLSSIIDVAFLGDKLYGITQDEDLISLCLAVDSRGAPTVTIIKYVINHFRENIDYAEDNDLVVREEDETDDDYVTACDDDDYMTAFDDEDEDTNENMTDNCNYMGESKKYNNDNAPSEEEEGEEHGVEEFDKNNDGMRFEVDDEEPYDLILTIWYLVESRGKLLMVRRQMQRPCDVTRFTRRVEVFEADTRSSMWVPVSSGLDGHALFISKHFSKSVPAGGEVEEDSIYFIDTGEVFNLRAKTANPAGHIKPL